MPITIISKTLEVFVNFCGVETAAVLANSMISSRIDYWNSLLFGVNKYNMAKLQKIQNTLCRIVFRHVTTLGPHFILYPVQIQS